MPLVAAWGAEVEEEEGAAGVGGDGTAVLCNVGVGENGAIPTGDVCQGFVR